MHMSWTACSAAEHGMKCMQHFDNHLAPPALLCTSSTSTAARPQCTTRIDPTLLQLENAEEKKCLLLLHATNCMFGSTAWHGMRIG